MIRVTSDTSEVSSYFPQIRKKNVNTQKQCRYAKIMLFLRIYTFFGICTVFLFIHIVKISR